MSIVFAGTSVADFEVLGGDAATDSHTTASNLAPYVKEGILMGDGRRYQSPAFPAGVTDFWASMWSKNQGDFTAPGELRFYDTSYSTTQPVFRVIENGTSNTGWVDPVNIQMWNGSSWTTLLSGTVSGGSATRKKYDFEFIKHASAGAVRIYVEEVLDVEATGINTELVAWTSIDKVEVYLPSTSGADRWYVSALIVADESTLGMKFVQGVLDGDGFNTDWTGAYTDIDETGLNTADFVTTNTVGNKQSVTDSLDAVIDTGHNIIASIISLNLAANGGTKRIGAGYRSGGTNYSGGNKLVPLGSLPFQDIAHVDPNTAVAWTPAGIEAAEPMFELLAV